MHEDLQEAMLTTIRVPSLNTLVAIDNHKRDVRDQTQRN